MLDVNILKKLWQTELLSWVFETNCIGFARQEGKKCSFSV